MSSKATTVLHDALSFPPIERAAIAEELLTSLDRPDPEIDTLWAKEAARRVEEYDSGRSKAIPAEEVFAELEAV